MNMSRKDFDVPDVVAKLVSLVDTYGLEHDLLHIEVTESTISGDPTRLASIVRELHEAGFVIELDDFGSGYSSIATLNELTLDVLKLDMSLVRKDDPKVENSALKFAVMMGKMLNLKQRAEVCGDDGQDAEPETGGGRSGNRGTGRTAAGYGLRLYSGLLLFPSAATGGF